MIHLETIRRADSVQTAPQVCMHCDDPICAQVCPVKDCIVMVDELKFTDNVDKWQDWKKDRPAYNAWFEKMSGVSADPKGTAAAVAMYV